MLPGTRRRPVIGSVVARAMRRGSYREDWLQARDPRTRAKVLWYMFLFHLGIKIPHLLTFIR